MKTPRSLPTWMTPRMVSPSHSGTPMMPPLMVVVVSDGDAWSSGRTSPRMSAPFSRCTARTTERLACGRAPEELLVKTVFMRPSSARSSAIVPAFGTSSKMRLGDAVEHRRQIEPAPAELLGNVVQRRARRIALELALHLGQLRQHRAAR